MTIEPPIANTYDGKRWVTADDYLALKREAARLRLTTEEREAIEWAALALRNWADERSHAGDVSKRLHKTAATLRVLLERLA